LEIADVDLMFFLPGPRSNWFNHFMSDNHIPVLLKEIIEVLSPALQDRQNPRFFDGTFGRGGHLQALLRHFPGLTALAVDQDPAAIEFGEKHFAEEVKQGRLKLLHSNFSAFDKKKLGDFDAMLIDLGVSSPQLDQGHRGFSFYHEGPLDMRMNSSEGPTAADLLAALSEDELNDLFKELGEIPKPYRVTRAIVHDRKTKPFTNTLELAGLIERVEGWRKKGFHPATQYFMALRLKVNRELEVLQEALPQLMLGLKPSGRLSVLTFHSLEDRIVKTTFKAHPELGKPAFKKVIQPSWDEQKKNSRARSAKLRVFERGGIAGTTTSE
jgi:16S rRNA (cytosine1402-N4)-methyltransferase